MVYAIFVMGGLGLIIGIGLAAASKIFYVYVDPLIVAVESALPGANCGGCGLPGCSANAEAIVAGKASPNSCVAGGSDLAETIAAIMGVSVEAKEPDIALPGCTYGVKDADVKYVYNGLNDCRAAALLSGGMKVCDIGCLGLGTCAKACPFGAIEMGPEGLPVVNEGKCTGCGTCEKVCPKHIIRLSSVTRRIMREYTTEECTTPCQRACPAGINISEYIRQISLGDYHRAVQVIKERNPFPTIIGRICPRPCESDCRRKYADEAVAINYLKRFAADVEKKSGKRILPYKAPPTNRKIAVIGGGVEGLSAAYFSARLGHEPTVFEATSTMGGLLRTAIADNRLPHEIIDWDIDGILQTGVHAETEKALGKDMTIESLLGQGFEAVFIASGGWDSRLSRKESAVEVIPGTYLLIDLLKTGAENQLKIKCGENVVIAGGDGLAFEAVQLCKRLGAKHITVLFREDSGAGIVDTASLSGEGAVVVFNAGISAVYGQGNSLAEVEYAELARNDQNMLKTTRVKADSLFLASGRFPELIFVKSATPEAETAAPAVPLKWKGIAPYKQPESVREKGLFAEGDALTDFSAAIKAIAAGRRGAVGIHNVLYNVPLSLPGNVVTPDSIIQNVNCLENVPITSRRIMPLDPGGVELETGFTEEAAKKEASRCLQCGLICYKRNADGFSETIPGSSSKQYANTCLNSDDSREPGRII